MEIILAVFSFILGTIIASFCGVVIYRVPRQMSIVKPNSFCGHCNTPIRWYDNIPLISYFILRGKCRSCGEKIGISSLIQEALGGVLFLLAFLQYGITFDTLFMFFLISILFIIAGIDYHSKDIYDWSLLVFLILSMGYVTYACIYNQVYPWDYLIGAAIGLLVFLFIRIGGRLILKQECLGLGDVFLMGIAGLLLGYQSLLLAILVGSVVGAILEVVLIAMHKKDRSAEIAFGPYLVLGIMVALLYGNTIIEWYLRMVI